MAATAVERCLRCGTKLRNNRTICPCCGLDKSATPAPTARADAPSAREIKKVAAKAGVKICPLCMSTVTEDRIVEEAGQRVCHDCAENLRAKAAKKK